MPSASLPRFLAILPPSADYQLTSFFGRENSALFENIAALRVKVWRATGLEMSPDFPKDRLVEDLDDRSVQFAVVDGKARLIAATRLTICPTENELPYAEWFNGLTERPPFPLGYISRLVVDPEHQSNGLGYYLDTVCIEHSKSHGAASVLCDIPDYRLAGLERRGFRIVQPPIRGIVFPTIHFIGMLLDLRSV